MQESSVKFQIIFNQVIIQNRLWLTYLVPTNSFSDLYYIQRARDLNCNYLNESVRV